MRFSTHRFSIHKQALLGAILAAATMAAAPAFAEGQHYVGLGMGGLNVGNGIQKKGAFGGYLQLGHNFSDWLGAEIRLGASGSVNVTQPTAAKERIDFVAHFLKPYMALSSDLNIYGLVGFAVTHSTYQATGQSKLKKNRFSYAYGLGLEYALNKDYSISADVWHMNSKPKNTAATIGTTFKGLEASAYTATLRYNF